MVDFKLICLDKSCCLGYNCVYTWATNQQESWVRKYCWFGKNHIWYIFVSFKMIAFKMTCVYKSCCLGYSHVDTWVTN